jgi:hypothetical protein
VTEAERATAFRAQCATRAAFRAGRAVALRGDDTAASRVAAAFAPLRPQATDNWDCIDPPEPPRPSWLGRVPGDIELPEHLKTA